MTPGSATQKLALMFILCDSNHDGYLSREEIENMYLLKKSTDTGVDQKAFEEFKTHLDTIIAKYDKSKDGKMSHKEFSNLCTTDEVFKSLVA